MPRSSKWSHFSRFSHRNPLCTLSPTWATWPTNLILHYMITRTIFGEEYRSWRSSLCNLPHSPVTSSLLARYRPRNPITNHPQRMFLPQYGRPSSTPTYTIHQIVPVWNASSPSFSKFCTIFPIKFRYVQNFTAFLNPVIQYTDWFSDLDSSVVIATLYGLDGPEIESRWEGNLPLHIQTGPGAHPPSYTMGTSYFSGLKRPRSSTDPPAPSSSVLHLHVPSVPA
jgi:hypothetical protein